MRTLTISILTGLLLVPGHLVPQEAVTLADGGKVYSQSCGRCHNPRAPNERSDREWDVIMAHMRTRANLSGRETRAVLLFLQTTNGVSGDDDGADADQSKALSRLPSRNHSGTIAVAEPFRISGPNAGPFVAVSQDNGLAETGRQLMEAKACVACHSIGKHKSGVLGPDLNTVFSRRSEDWVMKKLTDPKTDNPTTVMPQMDLKQVEREALIAYMKSVAKKK